MRGGADRSDRRSGHHPHAQRRVVRPGSGVVDDAPARRGRPPQRVRRPRAQGAGRVRQASTCGPRCGHQLGEVPPRRAPRGRVPAHPRRPRPHHTAGGGTRRFRCARGGGDRTHRRGHRGDGGRGAPDRSGRHRRGRHGRCAPRSQPIRSRRRGASARRDHPRSHLRRGGGSSRVCRRDIRAAFGARPARCLRLRRWQHTVHLRPRRPRRGTVQRRRRSGADRGAIRTRRGGLDRHTRRRARRARRPTWTAWTADPDRTRSWRSAAPPPTSPR